MRYGFVPCSKIVKEVPRSDVIYLVSISPPPPVGFKFTQAVIVSPHN